MGVQARIWLAALVTGLCPLVARAGDGVLEINQACAVNTGCLPNDSPGFPVSISEAGSYLLTSSLTVASGSVLQVSADNVAIDLNGFTLTCTGGSRLCESPAGDGVDGSSATNLTVRNGFIRSMGRDGLSLSTNARVENVQAIENGGRGIATASNSLISLCTANGNGQQGIFASTGSVITASAARGNQAEGMQIHSGAIADSTATSNTLAGFVLSNGGTIDRSVALNNGESGIVVTRGGNVTRSVARGNGENGIEFSFSAIFQNHGVATGNTSYENGDYGIDGPGTSLIGCAGQVAVAHNNLWDNTRGSLEPDCTIEVAPSVCDGTTCP